MKLRLTWVLVLLSVLMIMNCATAYGPKKLAGGYSEVQQDVTSFEVTFEGNQYTSMEDIRTYLTYRCSELTLEKGYTHFMIIEDKSFKHVGPDELADQGINFETTQSMSGGVNTRVSSGFEKTPTENLIGVFIIKMMPEPDPVYATASIDAKIFMDNNQHQIKR